MSTTNYTVADTTPANIRVTAWQRPAASLIEQFRRYPVANIGDALGRLGMPDGGIQPVWGAPRFVGSAAPVLVPAGDDLAIIEAVKHLQPGDVVVVNAFGYTGRAVMGDILATMFKKQGAIAAVVDGAVRDREGLQELNFPVSARAVIPAGPWKNGPGTVGAAVAVGGVVVHPGDIVAADADGVAVVPQAEAPQILLELKQIAAFEQSMHGSK